MVDILRAGAHLAMMKRSQREPAGRILSRQLAGMAKAVSYASANVPHYSQLSGLRIEEFRDLLSIPLLSKDLVRKDPGLLLSRRFRESELIKRHTSGSSGVPLPVFCSKEEADRAIAMEFFALIEAGVSPLDHQARIIYYGLRPNLLQRLGLFRRAHVQMFAPEEEIFSSLLRLRPEVLIGYPSTLAPLAALNSKRGSPLKPKLIFSWAETLSKEDRSLISSSFGASVRELYGSCETSWIAWECERGSMHTYSDSVIAEVLDAAGSPVPKGEYGEIAVTAFWQRAMPFLRYRLGDRTALGPECACGRASPTLKPIQGRLAEYIVLRSGRTFSAFPLSLTLRNLPGIARFQLVQEKAGALIVRVVPDGALPERTALFIKRKLGKVLPEPLDVELGVVRSLERSAGGKTPAFISRL